MKLTVLASGSQANSYLLTSDSGCNLIIECGVPFLQVKEALHFDISGIQGCILSHEHQDHAKFIKDYLQAGITVHTSHGTAHATGIQHHNLIGMKAGDKIKIGDFVVMPFITYHDCSEPFGYLIKHPESGLILFATDTYHLPYKFPGMNHLIVECNYSNDILDGKLLAGEANVYLRDRVLTSHMEINNLKLFLQNNNLSTVMNIVLIHLSNGNSNARSFASEISELTGKNVYIAEKGLIIEFNLEPF